MLAEMKCLPKTSRKSIEIQWLIPGGERQQPAGPAHGGKYREASEPDKNLVQISALSQAVTLLTWLNLEIIITPSHMDVIELKLKCYYSSGTYHMLHSGPALSLKVPRIITMNHLSFSDL